MLMKWKYSKYKYLKLFLTLFLFLQAETANVLPLCLTITNRIGAAAEKSLKFRPVIKVFPFFRP